jgi:hypothetical protein
MDDYKNDKIMVDKFGVALGRRKPENMGALQRRELNREKNNSSEQNGLIWSPFVWDIAPR